MVSERHDAIPQLHAERFQESGKKRIIFVVHHDKSGINRYPGIRTIRYNNSVCMPSDIIILFKQCDVVFSLQQISYGKPGDAGPDDADIFNITIHSLPPPAIPYRNSLKLTHVYT